MAVAVISERRSLREYACADRGRGSELGIGIRSFRAKVATHLEENGLQSIFLEDLQDLVGVARMRPVIERQHQRFWRQVRSKHFAAGRFLLSATARLRRRQRPFELFQNLLARIFLLQKIDVAFPGFPVDHHAAGLQIPQNFADFLLVERLNLLQRRQIVANSGLQLGIRRGFFSCRQSLKQIPEGELVGVAIVWVIFHTLQKFFGRSSPPIRKGLCDLLFQRGQAFLVLLEEHFPGRGGAFHHTRVQRPRAVHQHDNLAVIGDNLVGVFCQCGNCPCLPSRRHTRQKEQRDTSRPRLGYMVHS